MKVNTYKHRLVFLSVWLLIIIGLCIYPGWECKALIFGLIFSYPFVLPFALLCEDPRVIVLLMFIISAIEVGFCAWLMDKCNISKKIWAVLLFSIIAGVGVIYTLNDYGFEDWKRSPEVSAAMESPEVSYNPTHSDFNKEILIPKMLAGGMWGLYLTAVSGFLYAVGKFIYMRTSQMQMRNGIS